MNKRKSRRISFYSFKGGTGRSSATTNIAYYLAKNGANVGCIDFDIESAGLNYIFDIPIGFMEKGGRGRYLQHYLTPAIEDSDENFGDHIVDVGDAMDYDLKGKLYLLPAATDALLTADVPESITLMPIVDRLRERFETTYDLDYLLIDCRAGVSNFAIPSLAYTDILVAFFRWGRQHRDGTSAMVPWITEFLRGLTPEIKLCLVASNIPEIIKASDIEDYIKKGISAHVDVMASIYENESLKTEEQIMVKSEPESKTAQEYIFLAEKLREL